MKTTILAATFAACLVPYAHSQKENPARPAQPTGGTVGGTCPMGATTLCIPLDSTFSVVQMDSPNGSGQANPSDPCQHNDDDSSGAIPLQFTFSFYGQDHDTVFINNNGNVTFGGSVSTFDPVGFPTTGLPMIAPFWGDVDTGSTSTPQAGVVYFRSEPHRFTVIWDHVGYFDTHFDKVNTFELILTDGTDPLVGIGNNVCFCFDDMSWTTGDASNGFNGFGGFPATVGANRGNGTEFFQVGRFDQPGTAYDGPGGASDGVDFLDGSTICFNTGVAQNIPPAATNLPLGNTFTGVGVGAPFEFTIEFIGPEVGQTIDIVVDDFGLENFTYSVTPGNPAVAQCVFTPKEPQVGSHSVRFSATDDGLPVQTTVVDIDLIVAQCFLIVGTAPANFPIFPNDTLLVSPLTCLAKSLPSPVELNIPNDPSLTGLHIYTQGALVDTFSDPLDPIKTSAGLDITIGVGGTSYGPSSGLAQQLLEPPAIGGKLRIQLSQIP